LKIRHNLPMETIEMKVEGMDCEGCVKSVTRMLSGVAGVEKVDVSLEKALARVTYDPAKSGPAEFKRAVERAGYKAP
jgi:copper chaperone